MSVGGWSLSLFNGSWTTDSDIGFQDFPIHRSDGTYDMQEYWDPDRRGIAVSHPGYYLVTWVVRVSPPVDGNNNFSVRIVPQIEAVDPYGSTALYWADTSHQHSGAQVVRCSDLTDSATGVIGMQVDGYKQRIEIHDAQMHARWIGGL